MAAKTKPRQKHAASLEVETLRKVALLMAPTKLALLLMVLTKTACPKGRWWRRGHA